MRKILLSFLFSWILYSIFAQNANPDLNLNAEYLSPTDTAVIHKLDQWQDLKFGMIIHWGLYAVPGIVESWSICSEDEDWIPRDSTMNYDQYKRWYWSLNQQFKPDGFNPEQWADAAEAAGMKYVVFTTKHHDGFAMFNTAYSDFSIAKGPFKNHPKSDVTRYVFDAFRNHNMMIGAYFSKPDWHSQDYWWDYFATPNRHLNYKIENHPDRWQRFQQYTYNQINEIMTNYGNIDILWLDGGWVRPPMEDINMKAIATNAREKQPGIIIVDRTVQGEYENYRTPEKLIPDTQLPYPWETCLPLSKDWGYTPNAVFKSPETILKTLVEVVAKGGSLLLGVGPTSNGLIENEVVNNLTKIGNWLKFNGSAIYNTRPIPFFNDGNVWFTARKKDNTIYAIFIPNGSIPTTLSWSNNLPEKKSKIYCICKGKEKSVSYKIVDNKVVINKSIDVLDPHFPTVFYFKSK